MCAPEKRFVGSVRVLRVGGVGGVGVGRAFCVFRSGADVQRLTGDSTAGANEAFQVNPIKETAVLTSSDTGAQLDRLVGSHRNFLLKTHVEQTHTHTHAHDDTKDRTDTHELFQHGYPAKVWFFFVSFRFFSASTRLKRETMSRQRPDRVFVRATPQGLHPHAVLLVSSPRKETFHTVCAWLSGLGHSTTFSFHRREDGHGAFHAIREVKQYSGHVAEQTSTSYLAFAFFRVPRLLCGAVSFFLF